MTHRRGGRRGEIVYLPGAERRSKQEWLGARIRDERIAAGLTQRHLARRIGKPQSWLSRVEDGSYIVPGHMLQAIARALGVTVARLFNEHIESPLAAAS